MAASESEMTRRFSTSLSFWLLCSDRWRIESHLDNFKLKKF